MPNNGHPPPGTKIISNYTYPNIKGYKKIDAEEYKLLERDYRNNLEFRSFPSDGVWTVQTKKSSKSTTKICDIKKVKDLKKAQSYIEENKSKSITSFGGMNSKIEAANICKLKCIEMRIVNGGGDNFIINALKGKIPFTKFIF